MHNAFAIHGEMTAMGKTCRGYRMGHRTVTESPVAKAILLCAIVFMIQIHFSGCGAPTKEEQIADWIIGTWDIDRYIQENYDNNVLRGESESVNQGKIEFKENGTGYDYGGNFIGGEFDWIHTADTLSLTTGAGLTDYIIEGYSDTAFVFSIIDIKGNNKDVERWYLSK